MISRFDQFKRLVVHRGAAHLDDLLCAVVYLARGGEVIERRDPSEGELRDPGVLVCDVGGEYAPHRSNFDHHQDRSFSDDRECAFSLLSLSVENEEGVQLRKTLEPHPWFQSLRTLDTRGPAATAREWGVEDILPMVSPIEEGIIRLFEESDEIHRDSPMGQFLVALGEGLLRSLSSTFTRMGELEDTAEVVEVLGVPGFINESRNTDGTLLWWINRNTGRSGFSVSHDDRGDGWAVYRYYDDPRLDFSSLGDDPRVLFAHPKGFIAKTKERISKREILSLVGDAVIHTPSVS